MEIPNRFQTLEQVHRVLLQPHWRKDLGAKGMNAQSNALRSGARSIAPRFNSRTPPEEALAVNLIVNFIDSRPFSIKFAIKFSTKTSDLGFVGQALARSSGHGALI